MEKLTFIIALVVSWATNICANEDVEAAWKKYQAEFPLGLQTKAEYGFRKSTFTETHTKIKKHNAKADANFEMGHNAFSVMTEEERQSYFGALKPVLPSNLTRTSSYSRQLPADVDYRTDRCMPPVRSQKCGDCWAYSATAVVEFGKCKKSGVIGLDFSEQQLLDCTYGNGHLCKDGGSADAAWRYLASNGGQAVENSYPYLGKQGSCTFSLLSMKIGAKVSSNAVQPIPQKDIISMMRVLSEGRILSIYMQLPISFYNYKSGVFDDDKCNPESAHIMNVVGYGWGFWKFNEAIQNWEWKKIDYWIVRNSWGAGWGDAGYVRIKKGVNLCSIEYFASTTNVI